MAVQTLDGLDSGMWRQNLTGRAVQGRGDTEKIDILLDQIAATRIRLCLARDISEVGELLALVYRCEDRIKDIKRNSQRRRASRAAPASPW